MECGDRATGQRGNGILGVSADGYTVSGAELEPGGAEADKDSFIHWYIHSLVGTSPSEVHSCI